MTAVSSLLSPQHPAFVELDPPLTEAISARILVRGVHLRITAALQELAQTRAARLLRKYADILRVRVDLHHDRTRASGEQFVAKALIEVGGRDLHATEACDNAYKALDLLTAKLESLLKRRHGRRTRGLIRKGRAETPGPIG